MNTVNTVKRWLVVQLQIPQQLHQTITHPGVLNKKGVVGGLLVFRVNTGSTQINVAPDSLIIIQQQSSRAPHVPPTVWQSINTSLEPLLGNKEVIKHGCLWPLNRCQLNLCVLLIMREWRVRCWEEKKMIYTESFVLELKQQDARRGETTGKDTGWSDGI